MATKKPTTIFLVRHGQTTSTGIVLPGRAPGLHLSPKGREQAERVAERFAAMKKPPTVLYASPLERAQETAAPIAKALKLRTLKNSGVIECDFGQWTGKKLALLFVQFVQRIPNARLHFNERFALWKSKG